MTKSDWVSGDTLGLDIPAHAGALLAGGATFLTAAFRACGALADDNAVTAITGSEECPGGSTGRKLLLSVAYEKAARDLPTDLFVKFSRDFDDEIRDRGKDQMESEVRFALLSRAEDFPVAVPACLFADYHAASGTGILISQRIAFGVDGVEPHYAKCMDYRMPEPLAHYKALVGSVARLAGTHKAGRLPASVNREFPFDPDQWAESDRIRYTARQLQNRVARFREFAANHPGLLPDNIRSEAFIAQMHDDVPRLLEHEQAIRRFQSEDPDFIALCHWNANVDNAWFWRDAQGGIACGLMDWGRVSQMNVALALFGSLVAGERDMWDRHIDELLAFFAAEYHRSGGPLLEVAELRLRLNLVACMMGLAWLMDAPPLIQRHVPMLRDIESRFDPRLTASETGRVQLHMLINFLNLWQTQDFGACLDQVLRRAGHDAAAA